MNVLGQQPVAVAVFESIDEQVARLLAPPDPPPGVDQPEATNQERRFGHAKVVGVGVAHDVVAARELAANDGDSLRVAGIVRLYQADLWEQQDARIEIIQAKTGGERSSLLAPGLLQKSALQAVCRLRPMCSAVVQAEMGGDCRQATAAGPAHRRGIGMNVGAAAIFPDAGVGREGKLRRLNAERFEQME